jgi:hypothetical protein
MFLFVISSHTRRIEYRIEYRLQRRPADAAPPRR